MSKKATGIIILLLTLIVAELTAICIHRNMDSIKLKRQLDLGNKYLLEENYEQAIAEFKVAIEIDPLCLDAYLGIADAYIELEEYDEVYVILNEGIEAFESSGNKGAVKQLNKKITSVDESKKDGGSNKKIDKTESESQDTEKAEQVNNDEDEKIQEEMLYPQVKIKPVLDIADTIFDGRSWLDIKRSEALENEMDDTLVYTEKDVEGIVEFWDGHRAYRRVQLEDSSCSNDFMANYFHNNNILTREGLLTYWGADDVTKRNILVNGTGSEAYIIDVYTEYGKAKLAAYKDVYDRGAIPDRIEIRDIEKYPGLRVFYSYFDSGCVTIDLLMEE